MSAGITCFLLSTTYHLFSSYSPNIQQLFSRLDYSGIAILIAGSTFPPIVYGFDCYPRTKYIYLGLVTLACVLSFVITLFPGSDKPRFRQFRGFLFIIVGLLAGSPAVHAMIAQNPKIYISPFLWALGGGIYIAGALLYVARVPERFVPGVFDYFVDLLLTVGAKS